MHTSKVTAEQQLEAALDGLTFMAQRHMNRAAMRRATAAGAEAQRERRTRTAAAQGPTEEPGARTRPPRDPDEPLRIAAITFCRDEGRMLPLWIRYYGGQLGVENLYVVDDNSEDGSTDDLPCDVLHIPPIRGGKFNSTRMAMVGNLGRSLLELYDVVMFCDTDEFIVPDPDRYAGLKALHRGATGDGHQRRRLARLQRGARTSASSRRSTSSQPLLGQRQLAKFLPLMCKPAIKWVARALERAAPTASARRTPSTPTCGCST